MHDERKAIARLGDLREKAPDALRRNANRAPTCVTAAHLQLDRAAVVVEKTIARKTAAGKCHFCMHTKRSGRTRQRVREKVHLYASPPFSESRIRNFACLPNDSNFTNRSEALQSVLC